MDPLSLTASVIAVIGAASTCIKGLEQARQVFSSAKEIDGLIKDIEDFRSPFSLIEYLESEKSALCRGFPELLQIANDAKSLLLELDQLVAYELKPLGRPSRIQWLLKKDEVSRIRTGLKDVYLRLPTILLSLNAARLRQLVTKFEDVELKWDETHHLMKDLASGQAALEAQFKTFVESRNKVDVIIPSDQSKVPIPKSNNVRHLDRVKENSSSSTISSRTEIYDDSIPQASTELCATYCECDCHTKINWSSPKMLDWLLGHFTIIASGTIIFQRKCNKPSCYQSKKRAIRVAYKLPFWLIKKAYLVLMSRQIVRGQEFLLRMPRIRPEDADIFEYADIGNVLQVKFLFDTGKASPWDVTPAGQSSLLVTLQRRNYDMTKYLLCQGVDQNFEDQDRVSAVSYAWEDFLIDKPQPDYPIGSADMLHELFGEIDFVEMQNFNKLHRIVTGFEDSDLEEAICSGTIGDMNALDIHNRTPLYWAAVRGDADKVSTLLRYGASPTTGKEAYVDTLRCIDLRSTFDGDSRNRRLLEIINMLQGAGAGNEVGEDPAYTLLHVAASHSEGHYLIEWYMENRNEEIIVSRRDDGGLTPLDRAVLATEIDNVEFLIAGGANVNSCDPLHEPSIFYAVRGDFISSEMLLKAGARLDYVDLVDDYNSGTILHKIARSSDVEVMDVFIAADDLSSMPNPEQKNKDGKTALDIFLRTNGSRRIGYEQKHAKFLELLDRVHACRVPSDNDQLYSEYFQLPGSWPQDLDSDYTKEHEKKEEEFNCDQVQNNKGDGKVGECIESTAQKISFDEGGMETDFEEHSISTKNAEDISAIYRA